MGNYIRRIEELLYLLESNEYKINGHQISKQEFLNSMEANLLTLSQYPSIVCTTEIITDTERADKQQQAEAYHNTVSAINWLNDMFQQTDMEIFMDIDMQNQEAVSRAVGDFVRDLYFAGIHRNLI